MHITTRKRLNEYAEKHPAATSGLAHSYRTLRRNNPANFVELRRMFPHADQVGGLTVFDVGGNKARPLPRFTIIAEKCIFVKCSRMSNMVRANGKRENNM